MQYGKETSMKLLRLFTAFLSILLFASLYQMVAATIENDYETTVNWSNLPPESALHFRFSVKITIETELDNTWTVGKSYSITYTITLEDVGEDWRPGFSMVLSKPWVNVEDDVWAHQQLTVVKNATEPLTLSQPTGELSLKFEVDEAKRYSLEFGMYLDGGTWVNTRDSGSGPTYVDSISRVSTESLLIIGSGLAIVAIIIAVYYYHRRSKRKPRGSLGA